MIDIRLKRVYEPTATSDGYRVLVDRLWPRGVSRERAHLDEWAPELAPSTELRKWFGHAPARFEVFKRQYTAELGEHEEELRDLRLRARKMTVTLVYAARDRTYNDAVVLADVLRHGRRTS